MRTSLRTSAAAALAALLLGGLTACNGDDSGQDEPKAENSIFSSPGEDEGDAPEAPAVGASMTREEVTDLLQASNSAMTTAHMRMETTMSVSGQQTSITAEGDMQAKPLAMSMTMDMGGMAMEMRMLDETMYMKMPAGTPAGDKWIRMRFSDLGALGMDALTDSLTDPTAMAQKAAKHLEDAEYVGEEDVDGVPAKHYRMTVDMDGLLKEMKIPATGAAQVPETAVQDVWIDDEGRMVKMVQDMGSMSKSTITMSDFGKSFDVQAPPANQVMDAKDAGIAG